MRHSAAVLVALSTASVAGAQESVRDLDRPGEHTKYLTADTVDHWRLVAEAGEVLRVEVSSGEFDAVLELVTADGFVVQPEVDDPGSSSRFLQRLERAGKYEILVHGPNERGGGNYRLCVERFSSRPIGADRTVQATFDREGVDHVRVHAERGEILIPSGAPTAELIDPKGRAVPAWCGSYAIEASGDHYVSLRGNRGQPYELRMLAARQRVLDGAATPSGVDRTEELGARAMDTWEFSGAVGDFRAVELEQRLPYHLRVVYVDDRDTDDQLQQRPDLAFVPVHSKGNRQRLAFVVGRAGRFQIQVLSAMDETGGYRLRFGDPSIAARAGTAQDGHLPVGGSAFYVFDARPGELVQVDVGSEAFDPLLRVMRADGSDLGFDDDGGDDLAARHAFLVTEPGPYRVHVASLGHGGGGAYTFAVRSLEIPELAIGPAREGTLAGPGAAYWHFAGHRDQAVFVSARSTTMDMAVGVYDPRGIDLGGDDNAGVGRDALAALRLPVDGRYTVVARSVSGGGAYRIRLIDPDAP